MMNSLQLGLIPFLVDCISYLIVFTMLRSNDGFTISNPYHLCLYKLKLRHEIGFDAAKQSAA